MQGTGERCQSRHTPLRCGARPCSRGAFSHALMAASWVKTCASESASCVAANRASAWCHCWAHPHEKTAAE